MSDKLAAFKAGKRQDDILVYIADTIVDRPARLADVGHRVDDGTVLVLPGESGKTVFEQTVGERAMDFAGRAMETAGEVDNTLDSGDCPACGRDTIDVLLAFVEPAHPEVGGRYAEGPVLHAYVRCSCTTYYSDSWSLASD